MFAIISTFVLDFYLILVSAQVSGVTETRGPRLYLLIFLIAECLFVMLLHYGGKTSFRLNPRHLFFTTGEYLIFICLYLIIAALTLNKALEIIFFPMILFIMGINYSFIKDPKIFDQIMDLQFYLLIVLFAIFFRTQINGEQEYENNINSVYYLVFTFPFVAFHKHRIKRIIGIILILVGVFWSMKRGAIIAVAAAFYFSFRDKSKKNQSRNLGLLLLGIVAAFAFDAFFEKYYGRSIFSRLLTLGSDGGSGRVDLAIKTIENLKQNSIYEWVLGHDLQPTSSEMRLGAHNDFLEVLYRMGFVGLLIFLSFFRSILYHAKKCVATGNITDSKMLYATFWLFLLISLFSQLIYLPSYIALVALSCVFAIYRSELANQINYEIMISESNYDNS